MTALKELFKKSSRNHGQDSMQTVRMAPGNGCVMMKTDIW